MTRARPAGHFGQALAAIKRAKGQGMAPVGTLPMASAESFIGTVASTLRSTVTRENPILECELPLEAPFDGSRFEALIPPIVPAPVFTIRRKASAVFRPSTRDASSSAK